MERKQPKVAERIAVARRLMALQAYDQARAALAGLDDPEAARLRGWLAPRRLPQQAKYPLLGIIDYRAPDTQKQSTNIGDFVQTIAALGQISRSGLALTGEDGLDRVAAKLRKTPGASKDGLHLVPVSRDFSGPPNAEGKPIWLLAFGWFLHRMFGAGYVFPLAGDLRPIFVSLHLHTPSLLTDAAIAYLKRFAPIGCRDWTTVFMLKSVGVDAFFSGCLTTTLRGLNIGDASAHTGIAYVDMPDADDAIGTVYGHADPQVLERTTEQNLDVALERLRTYRGHKQVVTTRLHCYLPCLTLGVPVEFRPKNENDLRFDGLAGLSMADSHAMAGGIDEKIQPILKVIAAGKSEEEVYATWRAITRPAVDEANRAFERYRRRPMAAAGSTSPHSDPIHIAIAAGPTFIESTLAAVRSVSQTASRPLVIHALTRSLAADQMAALRDAAGSATLDAVSCDGISWKGRRTVIAGDGQSLDLILLPKLISAARAIVLSPDSLVLSDIAPLWDHRLTSGPIAGVPQTVGYRTGFDFMVRRSASMPVSEAHEFRRVMCGLQTMRATSISPGVLLLDLDRLRSERFAEDFAPFVDRFAMNFGEIVNAFCGEARDLLDTRWNAWPDQNDVPAAAIINLRSRPAN